MKYSETEIKKLLKTKDLSLEDQVKVNILNFIRTIHLNEEDFIESPYGSKFLGTSMTFEKTRPSDDYYSYSEWWVR